MTHDISWQCVHVWWAHWNRACIPGGSWAGLASFASPDQGWPTEETQRGYYPQHMPDFKQESKTLLSQSHLQFSTVGAQLLRHSNKVPWQHRELTYPLWEDPRTIPLHLSFAFLRYSAQEDAWDGGPAFAFHCKREVGNEPTEQEAFATLDSLLSSELYKYTILESATTCQVINDTHVESDLRESHVKARVNFSSGSISSCLVISHIILYHISIWYLCSSAVWYFICDDILCLKVPLSRRRMQRKSSRLCRTAPDAQLQALGSCRCLLDGSWLEIDDLPKKR